MPDQLTFIRLRKIYRTSSKLHNSLFDALQTLVSCAWWTHHQATIRIGDHFRRLADKPGSRGVRSYQCVATRKDRSKKHLHIRVIFVRADISVERLSFWVGCTTVSRNVPIFAELTSLAESCLIA